MNSLPKTVSRQRRDCALNPGPSAPESSKLTTRLPSHRAMSITVRYIVAHNRKASSAPCTPVKRQKRRFQVVTTAVERDGSRRKSGTSSRPPGRPQRRPATELRTPLSRYEQLMAAGGPHVLLSSRLNV